MMRTSLLDALNSQLPSSLISVNKLSKLWWLLLSVLYTFLLIIISNGVVEFAASTNKTTDIGAIIDAHSRIGKEEKTAMEIAVRNNNNNSRSHKLSLHFRHSPGGDPLQAAYAAEELIKEKQVKVIIGMTSWEEAAVVAKIGGQAQVPILSFAAPAITLPLTSHRWPFLVRMSTDGSEQMRCIAALVHSYSWKRVIVIYEDEAYGGESGNLALLSEALQGRGSEIEYRLVLPPFSLLKDPKEVLQDELTKLHKDTESRVFIVLKSSLPMVTYLFRVAKDMGFVGTYTSWIVANSVTSFLDSLNSSVISSMDGTLGIQTYQSVNGAYRTFESEFRKIFQSEYLDEDSFQPGIQASTAYDSIEVVAKAIKKIGSNTNGLQMFLNNVLESNFSGLSGKILFKYGRLSHPPVLGIVNMVGKKYKELDFWIPQFGFSRTSFIAEEGGKDGEITEGLSGPVIWPGDLKGREPKGWAMLTDAKPMRIIVPNRTSFDKFVTFRTGEEKPEGFCIDIFNEVVKRLNHPLPHIFFDYDGAYDDMIDAVQNKTYTTAIGDITILAKKTKKVEFTQPYAESGLSMIVPLESEDSTGIFLKPFEMELWIMSAAIFIYTMLIIWFLEHQTNPEFRGPWKDQISNALWFTCSTLFFTQRERLYSSFTRVVVVVWLCVVFILTSSYNASLISMLTVQRMRPNFFEFENLKKNNLNVGCCSDSFVPTYLKEVLKFKTERIKVFDRETDYITAFESHNIATAFLELPHERVFVNQYCERYVSTEDTFRYGGFGFKGSLLAADFSREILQLSENGTITSLEEYWFALSHKCSANATKANANVESLRLRSFEGLYILSTTTSTVCFLLCVFRLVRKSWREKEAKEGNVSSSGKNGSSQMGRISKYVYDGEKSRIPRRASTFTQALDIDRWSSSRWESVSKSDNLENHHDFSQIDEIEMPLTPQRSEAKRKCIEELARHQRCV